MWGKGISGWSPADFLRKSNIAVGLCDDTITARNEIIDKWLWPKCKLHRPAADEQYRGRITWPMLFYFDVDAVCFDHRHLDTTPRYVTPNRSDNRRPSASQQVALLLVSTSGKLLRPLIFPHCPPLTQISPKTEEGPRPCRDEQNLFRSGADFAVWIKQAEIGLRGCVHFRPLSSQAGDEAFAPAAHFCRCGQPDWRHDQG